MNEPGRIDELRDYLRRNFEYSQPRLLVVDPGATCGLALAGGYEPYSAWSVKLAGLPAVLDNSRHVSAIICEDFSLQPGRRNDPKMPSAQGIGMCRMASDLWDVPLFLLQPNMKLEGFRALDPAGAAARLACRNDHQRDAIDLAGKALKEWRKVYAG